MEKRVSQEEIDYAQFIVYYKKNHGPCDALLKMCAPFTTEFILQDVDQLKKPYPPWFHGVPTAVSLPDYTVHTGSDAMKSVEEWCDSQVTGIQGGNIGLSNVPAAKLEQADAKTMPLLQEDSRYSDGGTKKRSQAEDLGQPTSLEELMRLRSKNTSQLPPV